MSIWAVAYLLASLGLVVLGNTKVEGKVVGVIIENKSAETLKKRHLQDQPSSKNSPGEPDLKPLFSLTLRDYIGLGAAILGLVLAAGGGIGGGGILVPIYILVLNFPVKIAIPLSAVTVLGGAIANNIMNARKRHPDYPSRSVIDWELMLQMCPPAIAGALIGAILNDVLPEIVLIMMLLVILGFTAYKTLEKAFSLYAKESLAMKREPPKENSEEYYSILEKGGAKENTTLNGQYGTINSNVKHHESQNVQALSQPNDKSGFVRGSSFEVSIDHMHSIWCGMKLSILFLAVTAVQLIERGSFLGLSYHCGQSCAWIWKGVTIFTIICFCYVVRSDLLNRVKSGFPVASDIVWNETTTIKYPSFSVIAGLIAGLFGLGGGLVYGPLMLGLDVHPAVASATCACMILFISSTATISFMSFGYLVYDYAIAYLLVGLVSTFIGQTLMAYLLKRYKRNSYIAFSIGIVVAISTVCMTVEYIVEVRR